MPQNLHVRMPGHLNHRNLRRIVVSCDARPHLAIAECDPLVTMALGDRRVYQLHAGPTVLGLEAGALRPQRPKGAPGAAAISPVSFRSAMTESRRCLISLRTLVSDPLRTDKADVRTLLQVPVVTLDIDSAANPT
jgi:hypothetical protein